MIGAVIAPEGIVAANWEMELVTKAALSEPKRTLLTFPRLFPLMVTESPATPPAGLKLAIVGFPSPTRTVTATSAEIADAPSLSVALAVIDRTPLVEGVQSSW